MAKRVKESAPESGLVKVVDPLYDAPVEVDVASDPQPAPRRSSVGAVVRRFFELLLRLISWVIIFGVFGAALYYGLPMLYQKFVVPVEQNTVQMAELQSQQKLTEQDVTNLKKQLNTLEAGQSQNVQSLNELDTRLSSIETEIAAHTKSLAALDEMQTELQAQDEATAADLQREINVLKSMELLSRARLFMYQSNFGLARQDVQIARDVLADIELEKGDQFADDVDAVIRRLDLVLTNLPNFPVAASDDLDIAWQILLSGMPEAPVSTDATAVPVGTPSATPGVTLTATMQATPPP
jgi:hypothetical protein